MTRPRNMGTKQLGTVTGGRASEPEVASVQHAVATEASAAPEPAYEPTPVEYADAVFGGTPVAATETPPTRRSQHNALQETRERAGRINAGFADQAKRDNVFSGPNAGLTREQRMLAMNSRHDQYTQLMMLNCMKPLSQGVDIPTLASVASTAAVMWCMSPRFRKLTYDYNDRLNEGLQTHKQRVIDKIKSVPFGSSRKKTEAAQNRALLVDKESSARINRIKGREDRVPKSLDSAARELANVNEMAYRAVRDPDNTSTPEQVRAQYDEVVTDLEGQWKEDGLSTSEVHTCFRDHVGSQMGHDPAHAAQYVQLSHGFVRPARQSQIAGVDGSSSLGWNRRWQLAGGGLLSEAQSGPFTFRMPMSMAEHLTELSSSVHSDLMSASKREGPEGIRDVMASYQAGMTTSDLIVGEPGVPGAQQDTKLAVAQRVRAAMSAMTDDGLSSSVREAVLSKAAQDGLEAFGVNNPEEVAKFEHQYSAGWGEERKSFESAVAADAVRSPLAPVISAPLNQSQLHLEQSRGASSQMTIEPAQPVAMPMPKASAEQVWSPRADRVTVESMVAQIEKERVVAAQAQADTGPTSMERVTAPRVPLAGHGKSQNGPSLARTGVAPRGGAPVYGGRGSSDAGDADAGVGGTGAGVNFAAQQHGEGAESSATKGARDWRRRTQNAQAAKSPDKPRVPGAGTANVSQRRQAQARNSSYGVAGRGESAKSEISYDDPSTTVEEGKGQTTGAGRSIQKDRVDDNQSRQGMTRAQRPSRRGNPPEKPDPQAGRGGLSV